MRVVLNATNSASALNKKTIILAYHFTCEYIASCIMEIRKIYTDDNYAYCYPKCLPKTNYCDFYHALMGN